MNDRTKAMSTREAILARYHSVARREDALAPRLRGHRFRAFDRTIGHWLPERRDAAILDAGCGEGAALEFLTNRRYTNLYGFDLSRECVEICQARGLAFVARHDALDLAGYPRPAPGWDLILCLDLLEHLPKENAVWFLTQCREALAPEGSLVIQTPNMGSLLGTYYRHNDLTHEFGLTERTAVELCLASGFEERYVEVKPAWNATTAIGYGRELWLSLVHALVFVADGGARPRIPTKNLLVRASRGG